MIRQLSEIEAHARAALSASGVADTDNAISRNCAWLHGAGYKGLSYLAEALHDTHQDCGLEKDLMGLDLQGVSCVFLFPKIEALHSTHGRLFLRNVRHGLYLLRGSVVNNYGIGCPVDPSFALGGERDKNPYAEKLALAAANGVEVDDALWNCLGAAPKGIA